ncbi:MAG: molybdenum cofactor guanylyltransferase [Candidatus Nitrotoga sp. SPKER]|nr:MAG: molybdenum cofactor guanylyltransferase [Candidatus Nitrotoga sp. SPKER]
MKISQVKFENFFEQVQPAITTVVLAGGLGTRIGGSKGLQQLYGRPLIEWVLDSVSRQSEEILINVNGVHDDYLCFGYPVIADQIPNWVGPLAGLQSALRLARHDWVASVPCDTPFLPVNLIARLFTAVNTINTAEASVAVVAGKRQPTIALYHKSVLPKLDVYLNSGGRKVNNWLETLHLSEAVLDDAIAFTNINTLDDLTYANQIAVNVYAQDATETSIIKKNN